MPHTRLNPNTSNPNDASKPTPKAAHITSPAMRQQHLGLPPAPPSQKPTATVGPPLHGLCHSTCSLPSSSHSSSPSLYNTWCRPERGLYDSTSPAYHAELACQYTLRRRPTASLGPEGRSPPLAGVLHAQHKPSRQTEGYIAQGTRAVQGLHSRIHSRGYTPGVTLQVTFQVTGYRLQVTISRQGRCQAHTAIRLVVTRLQQSLPAQRGLKGPRGGRQVVGPEGDHLLVQGGPVPGGQAAGGVPDELLLIQREPLGLAVIVADLELAAAAAVGCQLALGGEQVGGGVRNGIQAYEV